MRIKFENIDYEPKVLVSIYNELNRIPFSIATKDKLSGLVYSRNLNSGNFLEFGFDKVTMELCEITMVSIQEETVLNVERCTNGVVNDTRFFNSIAEDSPIEISVPMKIYRSNSCINVIWCEDDARIAYYAIGGNVLLGMAPDGSLSAVTLTSLTKEMIHEILGF